jgi:hypothetical protein
LSPPQEVRKIADIDKIAIIFFILFYFNPDRVLNPVRDSC